MRTTLDLPDDVLREAKARAALRGIKLKEYVAEALRSFVLYRPTGPSGAGRAADSDSEPEDSWVVGGQTFPLIRGRCGPELAGLTDARINELLEEEDVEGPHGTRGR